ncbi:MAG: sulfite exporter TauE/SafE family protein [Candidatus Blackburnbacteria bacterium]|nr:sulfite exporter TauE/SafE family protein [Candidatus Blackburnbacteria bacterium]
MAVQGGLLASVIATGKSDKVSRLGTTIWPTLSFLLSKLVVYTILGFILGLFGEKLSLSQSTRIIMQALAGLYMIAVALNLLNVHPIFRYTVIQPPKFLGKLVRNQSKSEKLFAPALLGAMTLFIPCGTTLAMEALAISTGSAVKGALVMSVFILGTMPLFTGFGFITSSLNGLFKKNFLKIAAFGVLYMGLTSINGALNIAGLPFTAQMLTSSAKDILATAINPAGGSVLAANSNVQLINGVQVVDISVNPTSYDPEYIRVKAGVPVKLNLKTNSKLGCTRAFTIPQFGITKLLNNNSTDSVEFLPEKRGKYSFTCSMGMYGGIIEVI